MQVTHNGEPTETDAPTLGLLIGALPPGSAVAVNGELVPRAAVADRALRAGDAIEVVRAVAGG